MNDYNLTELDKAKKFISVGYTPNKNTRSRRLTKIAAEGGLNIRTLRLYRQNLEALDRGRWAIVHELSRQYDNEKLSTKFHTKEVEMFMQWLASCLTAAKITASFGQKLAAIISNEPAIIYELIGAAVNAADTSFGEFLLNETLPDTDIMLNSSLQLPTELRLAQMNFTRDSFSLVKISRQTGIGIGALKGYANGSVSLSQARWTNVHTLAELEVANVFDEKNTKYQEFQELLREYFLMSTAVEKSNPIAVAVLEKMEAIFNRKEVSLQLYLQI